MLIAVGPFSMFEKFFPEIVATDSNGNLTGQVVDFCKLLLFYKTRIIW